jgi:thioester reductase-like protein
MTPSILEPLHQWTERHPDKLLFAFLDIDGRATESYSYAQFLQRTADIATHIRRTHPMPPGARVLLAYPPGVEMICAFFACVRIGLIPVPVYPPTSYGFEAARDKTDFIARDCQAAAVLTDRSYYWSMKVNQARHRVKTLSFKRAYVSTLPWIVSTDADRGGRTDVRDGHSDVLFLQYTSGSTSDPKGVMVTHANILDNCVVVDHVPVGVSWLPQYHDMGLIGYYIFFALKGGTTYGFSPMDFIQRPALWLETITRYRGTASSAPNFAYEYCLRPDKLPAAALEQVDLSSLRFLMTAAEPVRARAYRAFIERFEPYGLDPRSFFSAYGLAEYTLAVTNYGRTVGTFDRASLHQHKVRPAGAAQDDADTITLVSCGRALGTAEVRIVDVTSTPRDVCPCEVGEIWIRGGSKCAGYWRRPELSAATFEARVPGDPADAPGWLRTGDLGFLRDGELYICGRIKDLIIVRGLNYYPQDIEAIVQEDPGIRKGGVAAFAHEGESGETLVVVAEVRRARTRKGRAIVPDARALNQRLLQALGVTAASFVFIKARTIPKTSSGKIIRHLARRRWLEGRLDMVSQVDVAAHVEDVGGGQPNTLLRRFGLTGAETGTLADAGFDSIKLVEFAQALKSQLEDDGALDAARAVDLRVLQKIAISELFDLLEQVTTGAPHATLRLKRALTHLGREHRDAEAAMMRRDARLRPDIADLPMPPAGGAETGVVLLTGGTGFFGPFLLTSLLEQSSDDLYVLVRGNVSDALRRLGEGLASVSVDGSCPEGWERRVHPVCGDLSAPQLGLDAASWRALADRTHTIYHNAALVNYLLDYHAMRDANVGGTNEIVRLAMSRRAKVLNLISTTFIYGWSVKETLFESDTNAAMEHLDFGYSQSKWVSEHVVHDAMQRGLQARIFRPALLTPSVNGGGCNFDISIRLLAFMINHGIGTTARNQVSFTPADVAAHNIVALSRLPCSVGGSFHVTRDEFASMSDITAILSTLTGRSFRDYPLRTFVPEVIARCHSGDILFPLLEFLVRSVDNITAMEFKRYDNSRYRQLRDGCGAGKADPPLEDVVLGILRFMRRQGLVTV